MVLLVGLAGACGGDDGSAEGPPPTLQPVTTTDPAFAGIPAGDDVIGGPSIEVVLLDPGAEPRRELRLDPAVGAVESVTTVIEQGATVTVGGVAQSIPSAAMEIDLVHTVAAVDDATITYVSRYEDLRWGEGVEPLVAAELEDLRARVLGSEAQVVIDRRGQIVSNDFGAAMGEAAGVQELGDQLSAAAMPLPEEAVGVGARWEVRSSMSVSGLAFRLASTFEITELTEDQVVTRAQLRMTMPPGLQNILGQSVEVQGGELVGDGSTTWRFALPVPTGGQDASGEFTLALSRGGESVEMTLAQRQRQETTLR